MAEVALAAVAASVAEEVLARAREAADLVPVRAPAAAASLRAAHQARAGLAARVEWAARAERAAPLVRLAGAAGAVPATRGGPAVWAQWAAGSGRRHLIGTAGITIIHRAVAIISRFSGPAGITGLAAAGCPGDACPQS